MRDGERVPTFPNARYVMHRADWEDNPSHRQPDSSDAQHLGTLERLGRLDLLDGDREIAPGITMLHAPGESPGHSVVRVRSADAVFYCLGDLFHHVAEVEHLDWLPAGRDPIASDVSRRRFVDAAIADNALLVFTHCPFPGWGRIIRDGARQHWVDEAQL
jgi:glyoxylase-like metal-dependent hydrolase (beta-lactamase superfamily II)